jgi:hypothetical protein
MSPELLPTPKLYGDSAAEIRQLALRSTSSGIRAEPFTLAVRYERLAA